MNPSYLQRIEEFSGQRLETGSDWKRLEAGSDWKHYVERLKMFFEVNGVPPKKRVPIILTLLGSKMYALLRSISAPRKPKKLSFTETVETVAKHLDPKPIVMVKRYKFHKAEQEESESIRRYLAKLQKLAETCEFEEYREQAIRDRFVLWFESAFNSTQAELNNWQACAGELTEKGTSVVHGDAVVKKLDGTFSECFRRGKSNHSPETCLHRKARCYKCQTLGHIVAKCPEKQEKHPSRKPAAKGGEKRKKKKKQGGIHSEEEETNENLGIIPPGRC